MPAATNNSVLISGAGVAGPALAFWLLKYGYRPTLVETAPAPREGGYMIDFWGVGYDVAERMGLIEPLRRVAHDINELRMVDEKGRKLGGLDVEVFRAATGHRYFSILRSDLAREIYRAVEDRAETIFGDSIQGLDDDGDRVGVTFRHAPARRFDLVIGADGLHSAVRQLAFGAEEQFEKYLGYYIAAFGAAGYPHRDEAAYVSYTTPGRQIARYASRGNRTAFFFIWIEDAKLKIDHHDATAQKRLVRERFKDVGWECREILDAMDACGDLYFDPVSQIQMKSWSRSRIALLGDAAYCPSLLAGQGAAFAMTGAYVLADALARAGGDHAAAFRDYEQALKPFIETKQRGAVSFGSWFAPRTRLGLVVRNQITALASMPVIGRLMVKQMFGDRFILPDEHVDKARAS